MNKKIVVVGAGVTGVNAITKLVDNGYPGELITVIDKGKDPYNRLPSEIMKGFLGSGGWSDGKLTYHTSIGGQLSKYCGEEKAYELMGEVINNFRRFHPKPEEIKCSDPQEEPDFIKPYFNLKLFPVYHIGTDYLSEIAKNWYDYLISKNVHFEFEAEVIDINFDTRMLTVVLPISDRYFHLDYDKLIFAVGKAGIGFTQKIIDKYKLPTESKPSQIGVRFEAPQHHFQKLIDLSYDFKLYRKDDKVSIRSFCVNNNAAYVAVEESYKDITYNGHAKKDSKYENGMTNFGIIMEIQGIEDPFDWCRDIVRKCQGKVWINKLEDKFIKTGLFYSPNGTRTTSKDSEGKQIRAYEACGDVLDTFKENFGEYSKYVLDFIEDLKKIFPTLGDDWGIYIPEVKYLNDEVLVNHENLSLLDYPDVYFGGDTLSSRSIVIAGSQGVLIALNLLKN